MKVFLSNLTDQYPSFVAVGFLHLMSGLLLRLLSYIFESNFHKAMGSFNFN